MKLALKKLHLSLHRSIERIDLPGVIYFFGPIGSGKSSIGRLIDFCLGGSYAWTPALQAEMVSAALEISVNDVQVTLHRDRDSNQIMAAWRYGVVRPPFLSCERGSAVRTSTKRGARRTT